MKKYLNIQIFILGNIIFLELLAINLSFAQESAFRQKNGKNAPKVLDPNNLTDGEKFTSENFVHEGLSQRQLIEACGVDEETQAACQGQAASKDFLGMSPAMVQALARMYSTVMGVAGGDLVTVDGYNQANPDETPKTDTNKVDSASTSEATKTADTKVDEAEVNPKKPEEAEQKTSDYCKYIATGTEAIALTQQTLAQEDILKTTSTEDTAQKDALFKASRDHDARSTQAKTQTIGWGSTTACYTAMMAYPGFNVSSKAWQNWAKLGAAGVLTVFFNGQIGAHEDYRDKVLKIAKKLPGKGDCNPVTEKNCYCAQEETKNDPDVCQSFLSKAAIAKSDLRIACVDSKLKADPKCRCVITNDCFDKEYSNIINGLKFGKAALGKAASPFSALARGRLKGGNLNSGTSKFFAQAQSAIRKANSQLKNLKPNRLSSSQQEEADALVSLGLSKILANRLASSPVDSKLKSAINKFQGPGRGRYSYKRNRNKKSRVLRFTGGNGIGKKRSRSRKKMNFLSKLGKKKRRPGNKVMQFAQKAQDAAQINNNPGRFLFDIISHRYQASGWKRLNMLDKLNE